MKNIYDILIAWSFGEDGLASRNIGDILMINFTEG